MTKIAVLIPTFKPGFYLEECLRCFDSQTLSKEYFHVYIALNGPAAGFDEYVKTLIENCNFRISYYYISEPGVSNARNFLIENSESEYVTFVDDDDLVSENYLEMLLAASSERFIGISNVRNFENERSHPTANYIGECFESLSCTETSLFRTRKYYSSPCAKLICRSIILNNRFKVGLAIGEDSLFMAQISNNVSGTVKADGDATYFVRQRVGSVTRRKFGKFGEFKRVCYLLFVYFKMLLSFKYNVVFILTRMAATVMHLKRLFLFR